MDIANGDASQAGGLSGVDSRFAESGAFSDSAESASAESAGPVYGPLRTRLVRQEPPTQIGLARLDHRYRDLDRDDAFQSGIKPRPTQKLPETWQSGEPMVRSIIAIETGLARKC
ncbi:MAG: hypothetical protein AAGD07_09125 [Planctomycetota bacterium]